MSAPAHLERAVFAGGRFWGLQSLLGRYPNVARTRVGYMGGETSAPTYQNIGGHAEAVELLFDPIQTGYRHILEFFFQIHDPTTWHRQGHDIGSRYRSVVFFTSDIQREIALDTIVAIDACGLWPGPVVTEVVAAMTFWDAEPEQDNYLDRNPGAYKSHFIRPNWRLPARHGR